MKRLEEIEEIVAQVRFRSWHFDVFITGMLPYVQVTFGANDNLQKGRKWLLSHHMTESEIVQTCLLAVLTALEHEAREDFKYKGHDTFSPHINVNEVNKLRLSKALDDIREPATTS